MARNVSKEQFQSAIPRYVAEARQSTDAIIDRGLKYPEQGIRVRAWRFMWIGIISDTEELREMWPRRDEEELSRHEFMADITGEGFEIALCRSQYSSTAWLHFPSPAVESLQGAEPRDDPRNLITPVLAFHARDDDERPYFIQCSMYDQVGPYVKTRTHPRDMATQVTAEDYRRAQYPPLGPDEEQVLEDYDVYSLHTAKIESLLRIIGVVAGHQD